MIMLKKLLTRPGFYRIIKDDLLMYIGESVNLRSRMVQHIRKNAEDESLKMSVTYVDGLLHHQLLELENDLIGAYIEQTCNIPQFQFANRF